MSLYKVLKNRAAVNILKILHDHTEGSKTTHTMKFMEVKKNIPFNISSESLLILVKHNLIQSDMVGKEYIISLSAKGKEFIQVLSELKDIISDKKTPRKSNVKISYSLTMPEKRILVMLKRISNEIGPNNITLKSLTIELFPYDKYETKNRLVSRYISKLEKLHLIEKNKRGREVCIKLNDKGERVIKDQFLLGIVK